MTYIHTKIYVFDLVANKLTCSTEDAVGVLLSLLLALSRDLHNLNSHNVRKDSSSEFSKFAIFILSVFTHFIT